MKKDSKVKVPHGSTAISVETIRAGESAQRDDAAEKTDVSAGEGPTAPSRSGERKQSIGPHRGAPRRSR